MTARVGSLSTRLTRLEAALLQAKVECVVCQYPVVQCSLWEVLIDDDAPLPTCPGCDRMLHPETREPFGHPFNRICLGTDDDARGER